jgi:hypothetical protein
MLPFTTRRKFLTTAALISGGAPLAACSSARVEYGQAVDETWRHFAAGPLNDRTALQRELVRYATLAPSSHNTQCWKFKLEEKQISIVPDFARRCPAVDPDDHHLFVSLGCATENLVIAGLAHGLRGSVRFDKAVSAVNIDFEHAKPASSPLFGAIPLRQCSRDEYDGQPLRTEHLRELEVAGKGNGVHVLLLTARRKIEDVLQYVIQGNTSQINDPAFMAELRNWIRFSDAEAVAKRDGLFSRASGSPSVPRWLAAPLFKIVFTAPGENAKYSKFIRSSAGIAVFVSDASDKEHWIETGRCYERFALQATAMNVRTAMVNQPVEVSSLRPEFAASLGVGQRRPDLVVRFGHGSDMPRSLRRPLDAVVVT